MDGVIQADAQDLVWSYNVSPGSGGGIRLDVGTLTGAGLITADGGDSRYTNYQVGYQGAPAGGGGRVAIYYGDKSGFVGQVSTKGGTGRDWNDVVSALQTGGAGTIYLKQSNALSGELIVDNAGHDTLGWSTPLLASGILRFGSFSVAGDARVSTTADVRVLTGDPAWFAGLISSNYLQVGSLWVNGQWVYGDTMELEAAMVGGSPRIDFFTKPNQPYVIEVSTNLSLWTPILTNASTNGIFEWVETNTVQQRFFRSRQ